MAALLGNLFSFHTEGVSDAIWGERFYQWGVAVGISKGTLHTIVYAMLETARLVPFVGDDESGGDAPVGKYNPTKSKVKGDDISAFFDVCASDEIAPLSAVPGLGKVTAAALGTGGDGLGAGWEPPVPGQDDTYKIPIRSFVCLMGHLLVLHQEGITAELWGERMFQWGAAIGIGKGQLHPIVCALLAAAETLPCVAEFEGIAEFSEGAEFSSTKSHTTADKLAAFIEGISEGPIAVTDVPSIGPVGARTLAEDHYEL